MRKPFRVIVPILLSIEMCFIALGVGVQTVLQRAEVLRVQDGDTLDVEFEDGTRDTIRYSGISAPRGGGLPRGRCDGR